MSPKQRIDLMVEPEQLHQLRLLQKATGAPVSESIRRAIDEYITRERLRLGPEVTAERARRVALTEEQSKTEERERRKVPSARAQKKKKS
jgi:hypothetical protein